MAMLISILCYIKSHFSSLTHKMSTYLMIMLLQILNKLFFSQQKVYLEKKKGLFFWLQKNLTKLKLC